MKNRARIALIVAIVVSAAACHRDNKAAQLKALDKALQSGVFTKEEYYAKKQAILGPASAAPVPLTPPATAPPEPKPSPLAAAPADGGTPAVAAPVETAPRAQAPPVPTPPPSRNPSRVPAPPPIPAIPQPPSSTPPAAPAPPSHPPTAEPSRPADREEAEPASLSGCSDSEFRPGGAGVQERFFPASVEAVHNAAALAFQNLDFNMQKDTGNEMEASKRKHLSAVVGAGGERLILHFESVQRGGRRGTQVTGETKKSIVGRVSQKSWTSAVLAQIECNLRGR